MQTVGWLLCEAAFKLQALGFQAHCLYRAGCWCYNR